MKSLDKYSVDLTSTSLPEVWLFFLSSACSKALCTFEAEFAVAQSISLWRCSSCWAAGRARVRDGPDGGLSWGLRAAWHPPPASAPTAGLAVGRWCGAAPAADGFAYPVTLILSSPYWYYEVISLYSAIVSLGVCRRLLPFSLRYSLLQE